ncbi:zinc ribbon domain-containing protein [Gemmatimonas sp.]
MALPEGAMPLVVGTGLVLGALTIVLSPLLEASDANGDHEKGIASAKPRPEETANSAVNALREIEFDRETGKLSDSDYADLKQRYTREALAELRASDGTTATADIAAADESDLAVLDPVEAAIARARADVRSCGVCGPRPEPDATYCSSCGRYLPETCGACGTTVDLVGSRFCSGCGTQLAAA